MGIELSKYEILDDFRNQKIAIKRWDLTTAYSILKPNMGNGWEWGFDQQKKRIEPD